MAAVKITVDNFEQEVLKEDKLVLVDFWASWCGPCKMLLPIVEELADELDDVKVCKVNVDEQGKLAQQFKVMTIPTLLIFKDGKVIKSSIGAKPKGEILEMLKEAENE
ncbi:MAG: thioredoxin [Velocimicrobium sp.]